MDGIRRARSLAPVAGAVALAVSSIAALRTSGLFAATPSCSATTAGAPMQITAQCVDPRFNRGVIDADEWRDAPVRHRYVNGHFDGTDGRFSFYFPPAEQFLGRFYQNTHQLLPRRNGKAIRRRRTRACRIWRVSGSS